MKNDKRTIFGWAMYDWAISAYSTVIAGAILPVYFESTVVGEEGWNGFSGESLWSFATGGAAFVMFLLMPVLGAMADYTAAKKRFLTAFASGWGGVHAAAVLRHLRQRGAHPHPVLHGPGGVRWQATCSMTDSSPICPPPTPSTR